MRRLAPWLLVTYACGGAPVFVPAPTATPDVFSDDPTATTTSYDTFYDLDMSALLASPQITRSFRAMGQIGALQQARQALARVEIEGTMTVAGAQAHEAWWTLAINVNSACTPGDSGPCARIGLPIHDGAEAIGLDLWPSDVVTGDGLAVSQRTISIDAGALRRAAVDYALLFSSTGQIRSLEHLIDDPQVREMMSEHDWLDFTVAQSSSGRVWCLDTSGVTGTWRVR